jgi:hypothetical protein
VVLAGHSYGGAVITNVAEPGSRMSRRWSTSTPPPPRARARRNQRPAQRGGSILAKDTPAQLFFTTSYPSAPAGASELYLRENIFIHIFASDLPRAEAERLWASQRGASTAAFSTPSKAATWKTIPKSLLS